jgi:hypothetical protein
MEQIDLTKLIQDIEYKTAQILLAELQKGTISDAASREMAGYILKQTDSLNSIEEVDAFLKDLAAKWAVFAPISEITHLRVTEAHETEVALSKVKAQLATIPATT